jgi:ribosomal RNA methyltransferase Nop2
LCLFISLARAAWATTLTCPGCCVQDVSDDEPAATPKATPKSAPAKAKPAATSKAASKSPAKVAAVPKSAPAKGKKGQEAKGFTDHNAAWLKPSKKAASESEDEGEEEEEQEEGGSGSDIEMEEGSIDGVGDQAGDDSGDDDSDDESDGALDDSFGAPADLLGSSSDEEEQGFEQMGSDGEGEDDDDDDDDESEEMEIEKKSRKLDARQARDEADAKAETAAMETNMTSGEALEVREWFRVADAPHCNPY